MPEDTVRRSSSTPRLAYPALSQDTLLKPDRTTFVLTATDVDPPVILAVGLVTAVSRSASREVMRASMSSAMSCQDVASTISLCRGYRIPRLVVPGILEILK